MGESQFLTLSTVMAAGDAWQAQIDQGSNSSPPKRKIPKGCTKLKQIIYSFGDSTPAAAIISHNYLGRLSGAGVAGTDRQEFVLMGDTAFFVTAGQTGGPGHQIVKDVDVDVIAENDFEWAIMATLGSFSSTPEPTTTLHFT